MSLVAIYDNVSHLKGRTRTWEEQKRMMQYRFECIESIDKSKPIVFLLFDYFINKSL